MHKIVNLKNKQKLVIWTLLVVSLVLIVCFLADIYINTSEKKAKDVATHIINSIFTSDSNRYQRYRDKNGTTITEDEYKNSKKNQEKLRNAQGNVEYKDLYADYCTENGLKSIVEDNLLHIYCDWYAFYSNNTVTLKELDITYSINSPREKNVQVYDFVANIEIKDDSGDIDEYNIQGVTTLLFNSSIKKWQMSNIRLMTTDTLEFLLDNE